MGPDVVQGERDEERGSEVSVGRHHLRLRQQLRAGLLAHAGVKVAALQPLAGEPLAVTLAVSFSSGLFLH